MPDESRNSRIYCNTCKVTTRHVLEGLHEYCQGEESAANFWGEYRLWRCAGCDTGTMEDHYTSDFMVDMESDGADQQIWESIYYPKRSHSERREKSFYQLPSKLGGLYSEVMSTYNDGQKILCTAGLRAIVEGICADKSVTGANLESKIEGMTALLPKNIVDNLHGFRFIGNRAVHELEAPTDQTLSLAIDVIEDILNFLYALDYKASLFGRVKPSKASQDKLQK